MIEKLLQYIWHHKILPTNHLVSTTNDHIEIIQTGTWNYDQGPDFSMSKIKINDILFIGNVELHIKSSDFYLHGHSSDKAYNNIILHVVFFDDIEIKELKQNNIPTLELKNYVSKNTLLKYKSLFEEKHFIPCEELISANDIPPLFSETTLLEKLNEKCDIYDKDLSQLKNDHEAFLYHQLAYAFGLKVNSYIFKQIAESVPYTVINKLRQNQTQLEALFYGLAGLLNQEIENDIQYEIWKREFRFIKSKFKLSNIEIKPKFSKLRPPNFPTIRLSQLANLLTTQNLYSKIKQANTLQELIAILQNVKASAYWDQRFNFNKISPSRQDKYLSKDFIALLLINSILPIKYFLEKHYNEDINDKIVSIYDELKSEDNQVVKQWQNFGIKIKTATDSQAFLHLYKNKCLNKKCLNCSIGYKIINNE